MLFNFIKHIQPFAYNALQLFVDGTRVPCMYTTVFAQKALNQQQPSTKPTITTTQTTAATYNKQHILNDIL